MTTDLYAQAFKPHLGFRVAACAATLLPARAFSLSTAFVLGFMGLTFRTPDELAG